MVISASRFGLGKQPFDSGYSSSSSSYSNTKYASRLFGHHNALATSASRDSRFNQNCTSSQGFTGFSEKNNTPQLPTNGMPLASATNQRENTPNPSKNNLPKEKYPEYIPVEKRRASYKNWPSNLHFLHPLDLSECGFFYSNFGDCVRCFHCGIGLRNWESDDNPWVEHARWSKRCPYLVQKKGQEFIDTVLSILGLQTDAEIEQQGKENGNEPMSGNRPGLVVEGNNIRDPLQHPAAQYVIVEKIFGDIQKRTIKKTMNQLLQNNEWDSITNDMLVNSLLESPEVLLSNESVSSPMDVSEPSTDNSQTSAACASVANTDADKIQKENEELKDLYTCKICLDEKVGITFVPCGHLVTCKNCSPKIKRCPLCRTFIRGTIKTTI